MDIPPDTKDWTWVLAERCPECGFDCREPDRSSLAALAASVGEMWGQAIPALADPATRPTPTTWSALEYACHVRDVFALASYRVHLMIDEDDPAYPNWDQDATALDSDYASQDMTVVAGQLAETSRRFTEDLAAVSADQWDRSGRRGDGAVFTVDSFARYLLHDPIHHLTDVTGRPWSQQ